MKNHIIFLAAAIGLLAGCSKEIVNENTSVPEDGIKTVLRVGLTPAVKTYLGDDGTSTHKIYWSDGDKIAVNGTASDALSGISAGTASVEFSFNGVLSTPYNVLYPASIYKTASTVELPGRQAYKAGSFADGTFPMAGYSATGNSLSLQHLCAVLRVNIKRASTSPDTDDIASVRFSGNAGEQVSGVFGIDYENATLTATSTADADKVVRVIKTQTTSTSQAVEYYLVVPARTYSNGFTVTVQDVNGHIMAKGKASSAPLAPGHLYDLTEFEFVPTGTELGVEISNAAELIAFAQAYNNKDYADLGNTLIATVTQDIDFDATSSAAFNATGGIGTPFGGDNYFNGTFNGNNKTISGLEVTVPLFGGIGEGGTVKDLTLDNTCSFTFTHPNYKDPNNDDDTGEALFGAVAGYHKGLIDGVSVEADVALDPVTSVQYMTSLGGFVGYANGGKIQNGCEYSGLISTPAGFTTTNKLIIGGLAGRIKNSSASVADSYFKGAISNAAQVTSTDTNNPYLIIGGAVGFVDGGATVSSTNSTADHAAQATAHSTMTGTIVNKTTVAYNSAVGGIVGEVKNGTVSSCTNAAHIALTIFKPGNTSARYMKTGGIVGKVDANGTVTGCTNNGKVEHRSNPRLQDLGGIAGYNAGTVESCTNTEQVNHMTTGVSGATNKGGRIVNIAGVIGENASGASVTDVHNTADIQISAIEDNYDTENDKPVCEVRMGGVIAYNLEAIDGGASKSITNSGKVNLTTVPANPFIGFELGGIVGYSEKSVKNASNSGWVARTMSSNTALRHYLGGIVGEMKNSANAEISGCVNSGEVSLGLSSNAAHTGNYIGGVVGYLAGEATATVSQCDNNGYVHMSCSSTTPATDLIVGGIIGKVIESGTVSECRNIGGSSNAGEVRLAFTGNAKHMDNYTGGIIGKSIGADLAISECSNSGYVYGGNSSKQNGATMYLGGIVAYLDGDSSIDECENTGNLLNDQFNNTVTKAGSTFHGGIAGFVVGTSTDRITITNVTNDYNNGGTTTGGRRGYTGGAVGYGEYVDISNATNTNSYGGGSGYYIGGIAGWLVNSTVSNSTFSGTSIESSQVQGAGGIVCTLDAGSTISGCSSYLNSITHGANACVDGDLAAKSIAGSTIQNCHYTGAYGICSDSNFTNGGGNVADL